MIGSIIGDIVGSIYEFHNIKTKDFSLFSDRSGYTDDSILTIATAKWILEGASKSDSGMYYYRYGANYPHPLGGYGSGFQKWLWQAENGNFEPYTSCGNGSAMRVGPVGWAFNTIEDVLEYAKHSAEDKGLMTSPHLLPKLTVFWTLSELWIFQSLPILQ